MKIKLHHTTSWIRLLFLLPALVFWTSPILAQDDAEEDDEVFELSPFTVDASEDMGYYASQSLAGGRLSTDIINTGSSIEVITADFMDDIGANDIQELLQYTNNTEIGGALGNFVGGSVDTSQGNVNTTQTQRNPDANSRIRGLSRPDSTRDFFKTDIPFDQYNTERVDINRGSNSFLFGLGSPAGLINSQLAKAQFNDRTKLRFRVGSGGERPSIRGEMDINRVIIKDKLAVRVATMVNRQQNRQRPTYRDDNRIYGTLTYHPFDNRKMTTIRAHWESGDQMSNNASTVLPGQNLDTWIEHRIPIDVDNNVRYYRQQYGWNQGDVNANPDRFPEMEVINDLRDGDTTQQYGWWPVYDMLPNGKVPKDEDGNWIFQRPGIPGLIGNLGAVGYGVVFDGSNGRDPSFAFQNQFRGAADVFDRGKGKWQKKQGVFQWTTTQAGDSWWSPDGRTNGNPSMLRYLNSRGDPDRGVGWYKQGFTDLETFDFSKQQLSWDNDFVDVTFYNYNVAIEQLFLDGKAGFEVAFDYQNHVRDVWTALTGTAAEMSIDINKTLPLPLMDANGNLATDEDGNVIARGIPNPNFGRPFVVSKTGRGWNRNDRQSLRATGFYKLNFEEYSGDDGLLRWLGEHTFSILGDHNVEEYEYFGSQAKSFSNSFDVGAHVHDNSARKATTSARNMYRLVYMGPAVQDYLGDEVWDPNTPISMNQIIIEPARYDLLLPEGFSMPMTYWNKGPDAEVAPPNEVGLRKFINGDEYWAQGDLTPRWVNDEGVQIRHTEVDSWAINAQSFFFNRHLVINTGYREDYIDSWLNKQVPKVGEDLVPDISPEAFRWDDPERAEFSQVVKGPNESGTFGYGAVLHWPKNLIKLPESMDISFHYNYSENFVPDTARLGLEEGSDGYVTLNRLPSPQGESKDWGVTFQLFDRKLIIRLNWYENILIGADSSLNNLFNQNLSKMFAWYNSNNKTRTLLDSSDATIRGTYDGVISNAEEIQAYREAQLDDLGEEIPLWNEDGSPIYDVDEETGELVLDGDGNPIQSVLQETDDMVITRRWPYFDRMVSARHELYSILQKGYWQLKQERGRLTVFEDGGIDNEWLNGLTDLEDLKAEGFEASVTWNPTRSWRMRINVARQETAGSNIAPRVTRFIQEDWLPWVVKYGDLDWNDSARPLNGDTIAVNVNENLLKYFTVKSLEGFPSDEVREWRVNLVTNYSFRDGLMKGFSIGGSMRYQSDAAIGYPLIQQEVLTGDMITVGDIENPWRGEELVSFDLSFGYSKKFRKLNWQIQANLRNLQNIDSDNLSPVTAQPDGTYAKVRWDPPFQWQITNTFRW